MCLNQSHRHMSKTSCNNRAVQVGVLLGVRHVSRPTSSPDCAVAGQLLQLLQFLVVPIMQQAALAAPPRLRVKQRLQAVFICINPFRTALPFVG